MNALAAMLRGEIQVEGDRELLVLQAVFSARAGREPGMSELVQILDGNTFVVSDRAATSRRR